MAGRGQLWAHSANWDDVGRASARSWPTWMRSRQWPWRPSRPRSARGLSRGGPAANAISIGDNQINLERSLRSEIRESRVMELVGYRDRHGWPVSVFRDDQIRLARARILGFEGIGAMDQDDHV